MSQFSKVALQPEMVARDTGPRANSRLSVIYSLAEGRGRRRGMLTVFRRMETTGDRDSKGETFERNKVILWLLDASTENSSHLLSNKVLQSEIIVLSSYEKEFFLKNADKIPFRELKSVKSPSLINVVRIRFIPFFTYNIIITKASISYYTRLLYSLI